MSDLKIARGFALPRTTVTEVIAMLATRGAGKSYGSASVIEELFGADLQVVVIDPMGVYWGLRSGTDGTARGGLPIIVLGGEQGDVPLEPTSGKLIADVVVDTGQSFVIDLSQFDSKAQQVRFMEAFAERLFYRKGPLHSRTPMMVVVDEADEFAPQKPQANEAKMLGHMIRLAKRGRSRGIGLLSITQRSAEFSKAILDLSSAVLFMRTAGPRDRKVIREWFKGHDEALMELPDTTLPKLQTGEAIIYSPHWLGLEEPKRIKFRQIKTYDSYKTPEPGEVRAAPRGAAEIDLDALGAEIAATVERAKENDPAELRKEVAKLRRELEQRPTEEHQVEVEVEVPVILDEQIKHLEEIRDEIIEAIQRALETSETIASALQKACAPLFAEISRLGRMGAPWPTVKAKPVRVPDPPPADHRPALSSGKPAPPREDGRRTTAKSPREGMDAERQVGGAEKLPKAERLILQALANYPEGLTKKKLATLTGYSERGGGFNNPLSKLRTSEHITRSEPIQITDQGRVVLGDDYDPMPRGSALHDYWIAHPSVRKVSPAPKILRVLIDHHPDSLSKEEIAEMLGYEVSGGGFNNGLSRLRALGLAEGGGNAIQASDDLFEEVYA